MQVVGEINNAEVRGVVDDVGYLLNDAGLPVDDGQMQRPGGWGVRLWPSEPSNSASFTHHLHNLSPSAPPSPDVSKDIAAPELNTSEHLLR